MRELFDVSLYKQLAQKLAEDAKAAHDQILADRRAYQSRLTQEGFETREELTGGVEAAQGEHTIAADATKAAQKKAKAAEKLLTEARQVEKSFVENDEAHSALKALTDKAEEIERQKTVHRGALIARGLQDVDRATEIARQSVGDAEKAYSDAKGAHARAKEIASRALFGWKFRVFPEDRQTAQRAHPASGMLVAWALKRRVPNCPCRVVRRR